MVCGYFKKTVDSCAAKAKGARADALVLQEGAGRDRKATRQIQKSLEAERKVHALETRLSKQYVELNGENQQLGNVFVPIELTPELLEHEVVRAMLGFVREGILVYWELGHWGPHIAGRFKTLAGVERTIYSPDANPSDFTQAAIKTMHALNEVL